MDEVLQAINAVHKGQVVRCNRENYGAVRLGLQEQAAKWIDYGDGLRAMIALEEVKRLDALFGE
jgi:hypothetical protein